MAREKEYGWYQTGCARLDIPPAPLWEFSARWQEFEDHAEKLRAVELSDKPPDIDAVIRAEMQCRVKDDPFVRAVLIGMAEDPFVTLEPGETFATD